MEKVKELEQATLDIIKFTNKLRNHSFSLEALTTTYQPSAEGTNFKRVLKDHMKELESQSPIDPEKHQFFKQFKEAVWKVHHAGEPMPGQEQDDIVMLGTQALANFACPISGKPVDHITDPVRSQLCRHIYDNEAVVNYIRAHAVRTRKNIRPVPCRCAAAGCPKVLTEEILVCDESLKLEIQEYALRQKGSNMDTVADCTYLEEDDDTPLKAHNLR